jgi:hypothetical protein
MTSLPASLQSLVATGLLLSSASAFADVPDYNKLFHHSTSSTQKDEVIVSFLNTTSQQREVQIGADRFEVPVFGERKLRVRVGSSVHVYSNVNSKVNGRLLTVVNREAGGSTVVVN